MLVTLQLSLGIPYIGKRSCSDFNREGKGKGEMRGEGVMGEGREGVMGEGRRGEERNEKRRDERKEKGGERRGDPLSAY